MKQLITRIYCRTFSQAPWNWVLFWSSLQLEGQDDICLSLYVVSSLYGLYTHPSPATEWIFVLVNIFFMKKILCSKRRTTTISLSLSLNWRNFFGSGGAASAELATPEHHFRRHQRRPRLPQNSGTRTASSALKSAGWHPGRRTCWRTAGPQCPGVRPPWPLRGPSGRRCPSRPD